MSAEKITIEQIEESLRKFLPSSGDGQAPKRQALQAGALIALALLAVLAYFVGRRKGTRRSTIVEVRRA